MLIVIISKTGCVSVTDSEDFRLSNRGGVGCIAMKTTDRNGDVAAVVSAVTQSPDLLIVTKNGLAIKFPLKQIRPTGRNTQGIRAIKLHSGDEVVGAAIV